MLSWVMEAKSDLDVRVSVLDDTIIVTMPGTSYSVTYHKRLRAGVITTNGSLLRSDTTASAMSFDVIRVQEQTIMRAPGNITVHPHRSGCCSFNAISRAAFLEGRACTLETLLVPKR